MRLSGHDGDPFVSRIVRNSLRLVRSPGMALAYSKWLQGRWMDRNAPYVTFGRDIRVGNFESFSHYWGRQQPITPESLELFAAVRSAIPGDYAAIDVGANLGITCLALADARFGKVIALEPTPATHERLKSNLLLNPRLKLRITVLAVAAGAQSGRASFQIFTGSSEQNGFMDGSSDRDSANRIQVNVVTIDQLVTANGLSGIGLLKIDVEGFEHEVLRGARQSFERGIIRYVYLELIERRLRTLERPLPPSRGFSQATACFRKYGPVLEAFNELTSRKLLAPPMGSEVFCSDQFLLAHQLCSATSRSGRGRPHRPTAASRAELVGRNSCRVLVALRAHEGRRNGRVEDCGHHH